MHRYSRHLYPAALALLGIILCFSAGQSLLGGGYFISVPGAGGLLYASNLFGIGMTALGRVVIGIVLIRMAVSYAKGQIETLNTVPARIGRLLAILGLFAGALFFAWRMYVLRQGPAASSFFSSGLETSGSVLFLQALRWSREPAF